MTWRQSVTGRGGEWRWEGEWGELDRKQVDEKTCIFLNESALEGNVLDCYNFFYFFYSNII